MTGRRSGARGLVEVSEEDLVRLLRAVHRGELACPLTQIGLAQVGLLRLGDALGTLQGLDERAVKAVLTAVIAERRSRGGPAR